MTAPIILENLHKIFGRGQKQVIAVRGVDLEVQSGQVYGFLGPNGAGKTTTIRMLMDLIRPTEGRAFLFGKEVGKNPAALEKVGALVEGATFYEYMSGRANLEVLARTSGQFSAKRAEDLLDQVGLAKRAKDRVSQYSLGMKQRLGIAGALLTDPELVILDEPTNGLDPAGIQEMRSFIRSLAHVQGKTVFLSSHLLNEVEQVCDRVAIIHDGALIREGDVRTLLREGRAALRAQVSSPSEAEKLLGADWPVEAENGWVSIQAQPEDSPEVIRRLVQAGLDVHQMIVHQQSLEEYFLDATRGDAP